MSKLDTEKILDVIDALVGDIEAYGDSYIDERNRENQKTLIEVVCALISMIYDNTGYADRVEYSMKVIGNDAKEFLEHLVKEYSLNETDNHSELIMCKNCQRYNPNAGDNKVLGYCVMLGSTRVPRDGYCAWAKKREAGDEPPKVRIGAFPQ